MINKWRSENKKIVLLSASKRNLMIEQLEYFKIIDLFDEILGTIKVISKTGGFLKCSIETSTHKIFLKI